MQAGGGNPGNAPTVEQVCVGTGDRLAPAGHHDVDVEPSHRDRLGEVDRDPGEAYVRQRSLDCPHQQPSRRAGVAGVAVPRPAAVIGWREPLDGATVDLARARRLEEAHPHWRHATRRRGRAVGDRAQVARSGRNSGGSGQFATELAAPDSLRAVEVDHAIRDRNALTVRRQPGEVAKVGRVAVDEDHERLRRVLVAVWRGGQSSSDCLGRTHHHHRRQATHRFDRRRDRGSLLAQRGVRVTSSRRRVVDDVAALDVGAHVAEPALGQRPSQLGHRHLGLATDVDAADERQPYRHAVDVTSASRPCWGAGRQSTTRTLEGVSTISTRSPAS